MLPERTGPGNRGTPVCLSSGGTTCAKLRPNEETRSMIDRRAFIGAVGAACVVGVRMEARKIQRLGMQLYTVRTEMEKDVDATLAQGRGDWLQGSRVRRLFQAHAGGDPRRPRESRPDRARRTHRLSEPRRGQAAGDDRGRAGRRTSLPRQPLDRRALRKEPDIWKRVAETFNRAGAASSKGRNPVRLPQPPLRVRARRRQAAVRPAARDSAIPRW